MQISAQGTQGLLGKPPLFLAIESATEIILDKAAFAAHWHKDFERWWPGGVDAPGIALLKVRATHIHYWNCENSGEARIGGDV